MMFSLLDCRDSWLESWRMSGDRMVRTMSKGKGLGRLKRKRETSKLVIKTGLGRIRRKC